MAKKKPAKKAKKATKKKPTKAKKAAKKRSACSLELSARAKRQRRSAAGIFSGGFKRGR